MVPKVESLPPVRVTVRCASGYMLEHPCILRYSYASFCLSGALQ
jgi:hypothetical protein